MKKLKTICLIIGIIVVVAGIIYFLLKLRSDNNGDSVPEDKDDIPKEDTEGAAWSSAGQEELNRVKAEVENDIKTRHEETKKVVKESVESIFSDAAPDQTKNSEKIQKMQEELENH